MYNPKNAIILLILIFQFTSCAVYTTDDTKSADTINRIYNFANQIKDHEKEQLQARNSFINQHSDSTENTTQESQRSLASSSETQFCFVDELGRKSGFSCYRSAELCFSRSLIWKGTPGKSIVGCSKF